MELLLSCFRMNDHTRQGFIHDSKFRVKATNSLKADIYIYIYIYIFYGRIKHEQPNSQFISKNEDKVIWEVNCSIHSGFHYCSELSHNQEIDLGTNFITFK